MKSGRSSWKDKTICATGLTLICVLAAYGLKQRCSIEAAEEPSPQLTEAPLPVSPIECIVEIERQEQIIIGQVQQTQELNQGLEDLILSLREENNIHSNIVYVAPTDTAY